MDNVKLYENFDWNKLDKQALKPKIEKVLEMIPQDTGTILDVGCGDGTISNIINNYFDVTAVDRSEKALSFVKTKKIQASSDNIPVKDHSFDMVFSSEMLEHLDDKVFSSTIQEFKRIAKKNIFITVPNGENPDKLAIKCPECNYVYNRPNHLRSFELNDIVELFPEYRLLQSLAFGPKTRYYNKKLLKLKTKYAPSDSWVPYYWIPRENRKTFCPRCEHGFEFNYTFHPVASFFDMLNIMISPKKPYWLFVLLEKI